MILHVLQRAADAELRRSLGLTHHLIDRPQVVVDLHAPTKHGVDDCKFNALLAIHPTCQTGIRKCKMFRRSDSFCKKKKKQRQRSDAMRSTAATKLEDAWPSRRYCHAKCSCRATGFENTATVNFGCCGFLRNTTHIAPIASMFPVALRAISCSGLNSRSHSSVAPQPCGASRTPRSCMWKVPQMRNAVVCFLSIDRRITNLVPSSLEYTVGEEDLGAVALVLDPAKAFQRVSLPCGVGLGRRTSAHPRKILRVLCGYFEHQRRVQFEGCVAEPLQTITAILPGSKWSCMLLRIVLQDALSEVTKKSPAAEVEGLCG